MALITRNLTQFQEILKLPKFRQAAFCDYIDPNPFPQGHEL
jgi:hypothetical protein